MLIYVSPFVSISIVERIEIKESDHPQIAKNLSANGLASKDFVQSSFVTPTFASLSPSSKITSITNFPFLVVVGIVAGSKALKIVTKSASYHFVFPLKTFPGFGSFVSSILFFKSTW